MPRRIITALLTAATVAALTAPPAAMAGEYRQYTCRLPDGSAAATDGWVADDPALLFTQVNDCSTGHDVRTLMSSTGLSAGVERGWTWTAPPGTALVAADLYRSLALTAGDADAAPTGSVTSGSKVIESYAAARQGTRFIWNDASNHVAVPSTSVEGGGLRVALGCAGQTNAACPNTGSTQSEVRLYAATFTLSDTSAPTIDSLTGSLTTGATKRGVEQLSFSAADTGGGVYRTIVEVDGATIAARTPDTNAGRCVDAVPNDGDAHQFQHRVPCPLRIDGVQVPLDTRTLGDGMHLLHVQVEDAAGNRSSAFGPATIFVDNTPAPSPPNSGGGNSGSQTPTVPAVPATALNASPTNGVGGGPGAQLSVAVLQSSQRLVRVEHDRSVTLSGRLLTSAGAPISNAIVEIQARTRQRNAPMAALATVKTDAAGGFRYVLRPGPSRVVRFGYRAHTGDAVFADTSDVDVRVKGRLSFKLDHAKLRNGKTIRFAGRVDGQTQRPLVQVQVRNRGRWVNVCVVRAGTGGSYSCRYRFRRTFSPTTYTFRALVRSQEGLPYETAASASRRLRVRP